MAKTNLNQA